MIVLISGSSHTGKTALAQRLMEKYKIPYMSIDHLKMGLIRSGQTSLTPEDDKELVPYLWNIVKEIIKTAIENKQSLIIEGCYIPFDWRKDLTEEYLPHIRHYCLIMTRAYIESHFDDISANANVIEDRLDDSWLNEENLIEDNEYNLAMCRKHGCDTIIISDKYDVDIGL